MTAAPSDAELQPVAWPVLATVAGCLLAVELAVATRYGFHRDELYFLACARHLSWGYVDQPPLVPAIARVVTAVFGTSLFWMRVPSAVAGAGTVLLAGLIAREMGGGRRAQLLAAVAAATSVQGLAAFHLLSTTPFDMASWAVLGWIFARLLRTADTRLWLAAGAVTGVALLDKLNVAFFVGAFAVALVACGSGHLLRSRWAAIGAGVAIVLLSPDVAWNATHGWAQLGMLAALHRENSTLAASLSFVPAQFIVVGPVLAALWVPGLVRLVGPGRFRAFGVSFLILAAVYAVSGAKPYYLAGAYYPLFAAGALRAERSLTVLRARVPLIVPASVVGAVALAPLALPVLPASALAKGAWEGAINKDLSATVGWRSSVAQIAAVVDRLPTGQRRSVAVLTGDYGAAGAVDLYGAGYGLPHAASGHNTYWWWGPGPAAHALTVVAVNVPAASLRAVFGTVTPAGSITTPGGVWTEERGAPIFVCTDRLLPWSEAWPRFRHYG